MGIRDLSQIVAIISYCATVVESSSSQWESYTVVSAYTVFGILDLARKGDPVILQGKGPRKQLP